MAPRAKGSRRWGKSHDADVGLCCAAANACASNPPESRPDVPMARSLLTTVMMRVIGITGSVVLGGTVACVIPPPLQTDPPDAAVNATPIIISSGPAPDFSVPGPLAIEHSDTRRLTLTLSDTDVNDTLHVRIYRDYGKPDHHSCAHRITVS